MTVNVQLICLILQSPGRAGRHHPGHINNTSTLTIDQRAKHQLKKESLHTCCYQLSLEMSKCGETVKLFFLVLFAFYKQKALETKPAYKIFCHYFLPISLPAQLVKLQTGELFGIILPRRKVWVLWNITAAQLSLKCWSAWLTWSWNSVIPFDMESAGNLPYKLPWQIATTHSIHHFREAGPPHTFSFLCFYLLFCLSERSRGKTQTSIQRLRAPTSNRDLLKLHIIQYPCTPDFPPF